MRSQDILVFCFILGSCLVSTAYADSNDKRARNFLGKRDSADTKNEDDKSVLNNDDFVKRVQEYLDHNDFLEDGLDEDKRGPSFLGKRADDIDEEKRRHSFIGKRRPSFLGKRGPHFLGKRGRYFLGKRGRYFLGKRDGDDEDMDTFDEEKRRLFLGKRADLDDTEFGDMEDEMEKRRLFLGKRVSRNFIGK
ncbi:protein PRQFV-amide-like [Lineus longissimus]|uniref:protein PRQFV-amide-like n=1 Tax=Lineus longissimus TaxID=88925 RepID=UPI002B4D1CF0